MKKINRLYGIKPETDKAWEKLFIFMDENDFSVQDFLACVCANLLRYADVNYTTMLKIGGQDFLVQIDKYCGEGRDLRHKSIKKVLKIKKKSQKS